MFRRSTITSVSMPGWRRGDYLTLTAGAGPFEGSHRIIAINSTGATVRRAYDRRRLERVAVWLEDRVTFRLADFFTTVRRIRVRVRD